jgi:hypothetical protein
MTMIFKSTRSVPSPKSPPRLGGDTRLSGADQLLAHDPATVSWLAKCWAEMHTDKRRWPIFSQKKLGQFLDSVGVDLDQEIKAVDEEKDVPDYCDSTAESMKRFAGCSFLAQSPMSACEYLRTKRALARS